MLMFVIGFLQWWYGPGWQEAIRGVMRRLNRAYASFSIPILLRTLFAPWRRITTAADGPVSQRLRALVDNLVSRVVGFCVRLIALIAGAGFLLLILLGGSLWALLWPALPILSLVLLLIGIMR